jgi:copper(I)-binding protein
VPITLSSQAFRRTAVAAAAVTLSFTVTACSAGFSAQTYQPYQAAEGTNATSGGIAVRNMLVLASEDGKGELHSAIVNTGQTDDTLVSIESAPADAPVQNGSVPQDATEKVTFGNVRTMTLKAGASFTLPPPTGQPFTVTGGKPGDMIKVTITFGKAASITTSIPVLTLDHYSPSPRPDGQSEG